MNDKELTINANKIKSGDLIAFKSVFESLYPDICLNINSMISDFDASRDLAQEIFIKVWNDRNTLPEFTNFKSYIYKISKNKSLNYIEKSKVRLQYKDFIQQSDSNFFDLYQNMDVDELLKLIEATVSSFPDRTQTIFKLTKFELMKQSKVADLLGVSVKTVESHIAFAKQEIKNNIKKFYN